MHTAAVLPLHTETAGQRRAHAGTRTRASRVARYVGTPDDAAPGKPAMRPAGGRRHSGHACERVGFRTVFTPQGVATSNRRAESTTGTDGTEVG